MSFRIAWQNARIVDGLAEGRAGYQEEREGQAMFYRRNVLSKEYDEALQGLTGCTRSVIFAIGAVGVG
jgi:hypothetical protein